MDTYGISLQYRHLCLLADVMTHNGYLMAISRHGINRIATGPLSKATFEEMADMLIEAAVTAKTDDLNGISARIIMGLRGQCGTGAFDLYYPSKNANSSPTSVNDELKKYIEFLNEQKNAASSYSFTPPSPRFSRKQLPSYDVHDSDTHNNNHNNTRKRYYPSQDDWDKAYEAQNVPYEFNEDPTFSTLEKLPSILGPTYSPTSSSTPSFQQYSPSSPTYVSEYAPNYSPSLQGNDENYYSPSSPQYNVEQQKDDPFDYM
jgi:DNA-directed RNA polymerase II subunit RPB1